MKTKTDRVLLVVFLVTLGLYALIHLLTVLTNPYRLADSGLISREIASFLFGLRTTLVFTFHTIPFFCVQLLLCRTARRRWLTALPLALCLGVLLVCAPWSPDGGGFGWASMLKALLFIGFVAPTVTCGLAWAVYGGQKLYQKRKLLQTEE